MGMTVPGMAVPNIVEFTTDILGLSISPAQRTLLKAIYALPLDSEERDIFHLCTGLDDYPTVEPSETTVLAGVRSGKDSRIATPVAAYEAAFGGHELSLSPGEMGVIAIVCQDLRATAVTYGYERAYFEQSAVLKTMLAGEPRAQSLDLTNRLQVRCFPTTVGSFRSWSIPVGIMNEPAFYKFEGSANADVEIQASIRRGMVNFARRKLIKISTPYMRDGVVWDDFQHWGKPEPGRLIWRAPTALMNPTIDAARLDEQRRLDPLRFVREFEVEFVDDLRAFCPRAWIESCVVAGRHELGASGGLRAVAAIDPSGGGEDAYTFTVLLVNGDRVIQAVMRGAARIGTMAPDLEKLTEEYAGIAKRFGCREIVGDKYAAGWVKQAVERHQIKYRQSDIDRSQAYLDTEPLLSQGRIELLDHPKMLRELSLLERTPSAGGKDKINHPRGGHDDYINALALGVAWATLRKPEKSIEVVSANGTSFVDNSWQDPYFERGGPPRRRTAIERAGLIPAPTRSTPSEALQQLREENQRQLDADAKWNELRGIIRRTDS